MTEDNYNPTYPFTVVECDDRMHAYYGQKPLTVVLSCESFRKGTVAESDRVYIGIFDGRTNRMGHQVAIGVNNGVPFLQACKGNKSHIVDLFELLGLLVKQHPGIVLDHREIFTGIYEEN